MMEYGRVCVRISKHVAKKHKYLNDATQHNARIHSHYNIAKEERKVLRDVYRNSIEKDSLVFSLVYQ